MATDTLEEQLEAPGLGDADGRKDAVGLHRIVFFSDGVFAIAMTLLAFGIRIPDVGAQPFGRVLATLLPSIAVYALSFVVIALYWVGHHRMFQYVVSYDYLLVWLNLIFLLCIGFLPVANAVLARHYVEPLAIVFYSSALGLTSLSSGILWRYASHRRRFLARQVEKRVVRLAFVWTYATVIVAAIAVCVAFLNTTAAFLWLSAYALWAIVATIRTSPPAPEFVNPS